MLNKLDDYEMMLLDELIFEKVAELKENKDIVCQNDIEIYKGILDKLK